MTQTLECTLPELIRRWRLGQIPADAKVSVTFEDGAPPPKARLRFGMFRGDFPDLTLEDFKIAEHHDVPDVGRDEAP